jgi:hypothetical protein
MYSLALIIFVVSEKKAFEHFPIGSIETKLPRNNHWKVLYKVFFFYADRKSKMATTAGHRLTLDPMGKCSNAFFSETTNIIKALCRGPSNDYSWAVWFQPLKFGLSKIMFKTYK